MVTDNYYHGNWYNGNHRDITIDCVYDKRDEGASIVHVSFILAVVGVCVLEAVNTPTLFYCMGQSLSLYFSLSISPYIFLSPSPLHLSHPISPYVSLSPSPLPLSPRP